MAVNPGETPEFDFSVGFETEYDPTLVADKIVWPILEELWHGDWRVTELPPGRQLEFPKVAIYGANTYHVILSAQNNERNEQDLPVRSVRLTFEEITRGENRFFLLDKAKTVINQAEKLVEAGEADEEIAAVAVWPDDEDDNLTIKNGFEYEFKTSGAWEMAHFYSVTGAEKSIRLYPILDDSESDEPEITQKIHKTDLETMHLAARVLGVSQKHLDAIEAFAEQDV